MAVTPVIPQTITVHLGRPNTPAPNVTVPFTEYIKNVASNEIYPTWPENAIRANILAQRLRRRGLRQHQPHNG